MKRILLLLAMGACMASCTNSNTKDQTEALNALQKELDSLKTLNAETPEVSDKPVATFLTFQENNAEEAMNFYVSLFENASVTSVEKYGNEGPAKEGTIMYATFEIEGQKFACSDSPMKHEWDFTPGVSIFVDCKSNEELERLFTTLSDGGFVYMPLNNYGFSQRFGFVADRFGVSWQLNLP